MNTVEQLQAIKALIVDPATWTQGGCARDAQGNVISPEETTAVCWCVFGAAVKVTGATYHETITKLNEVSRALYGCSAVSINDFKDHDHVMHLLDRAIQVAESEAVS